MSDLLWKGWTATELVRGRKCGVIVLPGDDKHFLLKHKLHQNTVSSLGQHNSNLSCSKLIQFIPDLYRSIIHRVHQPNLWVPAIRLPRRKVVSPFHFQSFVTI